MIKNGSPERPKSMAQNWCLQKRSLAVAPLTKIQEWSGEGDLEFIMLPSNTYVVQSKNSKLRVWSLYIRANLSFRLR